jgi:rubrerythrin
MTEQNLASSHSSTPDWAPFLICDRSERALPPRGIQSVEGIGDRLRTAAFAELQAVHAFNWGADHFEDAPESLKTAWRGLALAEERHLGWLLKRMEQLNLPVKDRAVSDWLWVSLTNCKSAKEFAVFMASAEERGRRAGVSFQKTLLPVDPETAAIFGKIAEEEIEHIRLAERYFPEETTERVSKNNA